MPQRELTQVTVEVDASGTERWLSQEVVESDVLQADRQRQLLQVVIEVDGYDWVLGRTLSGQFV